MNIIDSSLWLEYFSGILKNNFIIEIIEESESQFVPSICIYEVYKRILIDKDEYSALAAVSFMQNAAIIDLNQNIAILAAQLGKKHKLPMADSIIYATAVLHDAEIYTQDKHFENLDRVHFNSSIEGRHYAN